MDIDDLLEEVYSEIFRYQADTTVNVFLCGAATSDAKSLRQMISTALDGIAKTNVVFPEWLFSDLLAREEYNLLNLENELAGNVDLIILPLEGYGAIAELGAFASNPQIRSKILALNSETHKRQKSFINLGPMKLIRQEHPENVIYYAVGDLDDVVSKVASRVKYMKKREVKTDVNNFFNLSRFILFLIGILQPVHKEELVSRLSKWEPNIEPHLLEPSLKILIRNGTILADISNYVDYYRLSEEGHHYVYEDILPNLGKTKVFCRIRTEVMNNILSIRRKVDFSKERERFLAVS